MDKLVIEGGHRLTGTIHVGGSKNTALPLMAAAVLADGVTKLHNMPVLRDVHTFANVLRVAGASVEYRPDEDPSTPDTMVVDASKIDHPEAPYDLVKQMRASFYMLGALLGRSGRARVSLPGGCAWGPRPVDLHLDGMKALGAEVDLDRGYVVARAQNGRLEGGRFEFGTVSVGATINVLLAAVMAKGTSVLENVAAEPDVVVFGEALQQMGAKIDGLGTRTLTVEGVDRLDPIDFWNCPDRIELGTYMIAAAMAGEPGSTFEITGARADHLGADFPEAFRATGADFSTRPEAEGPHEVVTVQVPETIEPVSISTDPYPGFATDLQAQWTVLMTQAKGNSEVVDTIYTDRFKHIPELQRMGANCIVVGNKVVIEGKGRDNLSGTTVMSTDLRASVSLVLAGMVADGTTDVLRVYHLDRGYEDLEGKLSKAGIAIRREEYQERQVEEIPAGG
ncbi:MAG: UDP-N-acetylglucosamine 1-carboxyvinyltransferase [Rhodothermales bacterium]|nr:UDP-N-acetylglucosamine 1-carboxyvinyltransferase [Rhodothermales bacterium]